MKRLMLGVMVFGVAAASQAKWTVVDKFNDYSVGTVDTVTGGKWTTHPTPGSGKATIVAEAAGNSLRAVGSSWAGPETDLGVNALEDGTTSTIFFRVLREGTDNDCMIGLAPTVDDIGSGAGYVDYAIMLFISKVDKLQVRDGGTPREILTMAQNTWYNIWVVFHSDTDRYDIYTSTGNNNGTLYMANMVFSNQYDRSIHTSPEGSSLAAFGMSQNGSSGVRVDNVQVDSTGENTTFSNKALFLIGIH